MKGRGSWSYPILVEVVFFGSPPLLSQWGLFPPWWWYQVHKETFSPDLHYLWGPVSGSSEGAYCICTRSGRWCLHRSSENTGMPRPAMVRLSAIQCYRVTIVPHPHSLLEPLFSVLLGQSRESGPVCMAILQCYSLSCVSCSEFISWWQIINGVYSEASALWTRNIF